MVVTPTGHADRCRCSRKPIRTGQAIVSELDGISKREWEAQGRRCACKYATASKELTMVGPGLGLARLLLFLLDVLLLLCVALL